MPIDTDFTFHQVVAEGVRAPHLAAAPPAAFTDPRGLLAGFVNNAPSGNNAKHSWQGHGFNLIWRPNFGGASGPHDFFLELNLTDETLDFTDITGTGVANRGLLQRDIFLGSIAYLQQIKDAFDGSGQHFEPGVWGNVPNTVNPLEPTSVVRMGSIPHGTTINLQGVSFVAPAPVFSPASITPFKIGSPDDGATGLVHFPEEILATATTSRTSLTRLPGLTQAHLTNPNQFLSDIVAGQTVVNTSVLIIASQPALLPAPAPPVPAHTSIGGGLDNIAFLTGTAAGPNANVTDVTAIFWIETIKKADGTTFLQLQYTQRVLLAFKGLKWPHITVATLR